MRGFIEAEVKLVLIELSLLSAVLRRFMSSFKLHQTGETILLFILLYTHYTYSSLNPIRSNRDLHWFDKIHLYYPHLHCSVHTFKKASQLLLKPRA